MARLKETDPEIYEAIRREIKREQEKIILIASENYASEAVLPFYVLHQPVLLSVGYFVVGWAIPDPLKWIVIVAGSFAIILVAYEFLVRRFNWLRILFGMKAVGRTAPETTVLTQPLSERP